MQVVDSLTHGLVEVRCAGILPDGGRVDVLWMATSVSNCLHWELRRIFSSAGYVEVNGKEKTKLFHAYNRVVEAMRPTTLSIFGPEVELFGKSWHAQRKGGVLAVSESLASDYHWCSTVGLVFLLCFFPTYRRSESHKLRNSLLLRMLFENVLTRDDALSCLTNDPPLATPSECTLDDDLAIHCKCVAHFVGNQRAALFLRTQSTGQALLAEMLLELWQHRGCHNCRVWLRSLLERISHLIDYSVDEWNRFGGRACADHFLETPNGKRRRVSNGIKDQLMHDAVVKTSGESTAKHMRGLGLNLDESLARQWERDKLCERKAARWLSLTMPQAVSVCFDAARIGKPARGVMAGLIFGCGTGYGAILTPQDRLSNTSHIRGRFWWGWSKRGLGQRRLLEEGLEQQGRSSGHSATWPKG